MLILSTTQDVRQLKVFFPRLLTVKAFACSVNKYPVNSYRPRTVVGTRDANSSQAGHIALFTDSKRRATWEVRGDLLKRQQEQMWVRNLLLHRHLKGSDSPTRDKQAWDWLKGRRVGEVSEAGTHCCGEGWGGQLWSQRAATIVCLSSPGKPPTKTPIQELPGLGLLSTQDAVCGSSWLRTHGAKRKSLSAPVSLQCENWHPTLHPLCIKNTNFPIHLLSVEAKFVFSKFLKTCLVSILSLLFWSLTSRHLTKVGKASSALDSKYRHRLWGQSGSYFCIQAFGLSICSAL